MNCERCLVRRNSIAEQRTKSENHDPRSNRKGWPSPRTLRKIVGRVVEIAEPERIILFGSAARGEMGPNSDIDLLVVKANVHRRQLARQIYRHLVGVGRAVDVIVVTPEDIERYRDSPALIIAPALCEGQVIYAA
jgi:uncharacterized protein